MRAFSFLLGLALLAPLRAAEEPVQVVGCVSNVMVARPPVSAFTTVLVHLHAPSEVAGATLALTTDTDDRRRTRQLFPLGSTYVLDLPAGTFKNLRNQRESQERIEQSVDQGTRPELISPATTLTEIRLVDLPRPPAPAAIQPSTSVSAEKIVVTTPTGRKERVTRHYTLREIEAGAAAPRLGKNAFDIQHPVYPEKNGLAELRTRFKAGDQLWYFQGLDSGWAIIRNGQVAWVLVTHHEY